MPLNCPWCGSVIDKSVVGKLTKVPQPAPCCGQPIAESIWQVLFSVLLLLPLLALILYVATALDNSGNRSGAIALFLFGCTGGIYVQKFFPVVHGPSKGFARRNSP